MSDRKRTTLIHFIKTHPLLLLLAVVTLAADTAYMTMVPLVPFYFRSRFHVSHEALIGLAVSAYVFSETVMKPVTGAMGDRIRRQHLIIFALLLGTITPFFLYLSNMAHWFILVRVIDGVGAAAIWPAMIALFADITDERDRATAMSLFTVCMLAGTGAGFAASPFLKAYFNSYNSVFIMNSCLMAGGLIVMLIIYSRLKTATHPVASGVERAPDLAAFARQIRDLLRDKAVSHKLIVLMVLAFLQFLGTSMIAPTTFLFAADEIGWTEKHVWRAVLIAVAAIGLLGVPAGRLADRIGKELAVKIGFAMCGLCLAMMYVVRQDWTLALAVLGYGVSFALGAPAWMALVTQGRWSGARGAVLGVVSALHGAGAVVGPLLGTYIYHRFGHYEPFGLCALVLIACTIVAAACLKPGKN